MLDLDKGLVPRTRSHSLPQRHKHCLCKGLSFCGRKGAFANFIYKAAIRWSLRHALYAGASRRAAWPSSRPALLPMAFRRRSPQRSGGRGRAKGVLVVLQIVCVVCSARGHLLLACSCRAGVGLASKADALLLKALLLKAQHVYIRLRRLVESLLPTQPCTEQGPTEP
jgi:hypothetical protein